MVIDLQTISDTEELARKGETNLDIPQGKLLV